MSENKKASSVWRAILSNAKVQFDVTVTLLLSFLYFVLASLFSINRYMRLWSSYFDLGIMHQTVYNSFVALKTLNPALFLSLTDPHGSGLQVHRFSIHADWFLGLLAPFYFISQSPVVLLIIQSFFVAIGGIGIVLLFRYFTNTKPSLFLRLTTILVVASYFFYTPLQYANLYEFHPVTILNGLLILLVWAFFDGRKKLFLLLSIVALSTKEQVGLSLCVFLVVSFLLHRLGFLKVKSLEGGQKFRYLGLAIFFAIYSIGMVMYVMPLFRSGSAHFAANYYVNDSSLSGNLTSLFIKLFSVDTIIYLHTLSKSLGYLNVLSPFTLAALPDFLINTASSNANLRNIYFHYTSVITPWFFVTIAFVFATLNRFKRSFFYVVCGLLLLSQILTIRNTPFVRAFVKREVTTSINSTFIALQELDKSIDKLVPVSATGHIAPLFSGRRYFYDFGKNYSKADVIIVSPGDIKNDWANQDLQKWYNNLRKDNTFRETGRINEIIVFRRVAPPLP